MTPQQVIDHYRTEQAVADALGCTRQAVNYWKRMNKVPYKMQAVIQLRTRGKLKADNDKNTAR